MEGLVAKAGSIRIVPFSSTRRGSSAAKATGSGERELQGTQKRINASKSVQRSALSSLTDRMPKWPDSARQIKKKSVKMVLHEPAAWCNIRCFIL